MNIKNRAFSTIRRNIFEPLYVLKNRSPLLTHWKKLELTQYDEYEILRERQWNKCLKLIDYVIHNNEFYSKKYSLHGIDIARLKSPSDLLNIPIVKKEEIRKNALSIITNGYQMSNLLKYKTGGSTGKSLELYITEECSELRNACARRHDRWTGWKVGEPIGAVWGNPEIPTSIKTLLKDNFLYPKIYLDTMNISMREIRKFAHDWELVKPSILFGHAHSLYMLAIDIDKYNITNINPKAIISSSMMLLPNERTVIENIFNVKVFDRYGCEEVGLIASECEEHNGMHINIDHLIVEFIKDDGTEAKEGEQGRIILTDLINYSMPFIRYEIEDIGIPKMMSCTCGRGLPLMEKVIGRVADFLLKRDGSKVAGISLIENTLTKIPGILQMQIIQEKIDTMKIYIVKDNMYTNNNERELIMYFKYIFGIETNINIIYKDNIDPEISGKYRFSICNAKS